MNFKCKHCGGNDFTFERKVVEYSDILSFYDDGHGNLYIDNHDVFDVLIDDEPGTISCSCGEEWLEHDSKDNIELIKEEEE